MSAGWSMHNGLAVRVLTLLVLVLCWLLCTVAQLEKYLSMRGAAAASVAGCAGVVALLLLLRRFYRQGNDVARLTLVLAYAVLVLSFLLLYPRSQHHAVGKGSDREDALRVELAAVTRHQYPYAARTYLGHQPTPLPGAMWLAAPFYAAGLIALQNLVWAAAFIFLLTRYFEKRATALGFVVLFMLTALENLNDFDVGGDYLTNIMYIAVALFVFTQNVERSAVPWRTLLAVVFLGVALSSRVVYVVAIPPLLAYTLQRTSLRRGLLMVGGSLLVAAAVTLPVFAPHPVARLLAQLNQNADKLRLVSEYVPVRALPVVALAVASTGFLVRMSLALLYLLVGIASLIMILPAMASLVYAEGGLRQPLSTDLEYFAASLVFIALWAMARWEAQGVTPRMSSACSLREHCEDAPVEKVAIGKGPSSLLSIPERG